MQGALLLDVIVRKGAAVLELLSCEDQTLLIWRDTFLVLDLRFHVVDRVAGLHIECDGLARQGLHEDLHASAKAQHKVKGALLLDVIIRKGAAVLKLLSCEDKSLLIRRNTFLVLDLRF